MDSSPGFGSTATNSSGRLLCTARPFGLGFPPAPGITPLASLATVTRRFVLQKARDHARAKPQHALAVCRRTGSGSLSLPSTGCFSPFPHGTVRYRSRAVFSLGGWSPLLPTGSRVSRRTPGSRSEPHHFRLRGSHPSRGPFQQPSASGLVCHSVLGAAAPAIGPSYPTSATPAGFDTDLVSAAPVSFATTPGILSSPRGTEMFQFPRCLSILYGFKHG